MRLGLVLPVVSALLLVSAPGAAQSSGSGGRVSYRSGSHSMPRCRLEPERDCGLVAVSVGLGALSSAYLGLYLWNSERPAPLHAAGAIAGGLSLAVGAGFALDSKLKDTHQQLGAGFAILAGAPAFLLGLHALVTADDARDAEKPTTLPSWYGSQYIRIDLPLPTSVVDAHGALSPAVSMNGAFL